MFLLYPKLKASGEVKYQYILYNTSKVEHNSSIMPNEHMQLKEINV